LPPSKPPTSPPSQLERSSPEIGFLRMAWRWLWGGAPPPRRDAGGATAPARVLATFRRKNDPWSVSRLPKSKKNASGGRRAIVSSIELGEPRQGSVLFACLATALPMLIKLSAMTPRPTQRFMPLSLL